MQWIHQSHFQAGDDGPEWEPARAVNQLDAEEPEGGEGGK